MSSIDLINYFHNCHDLHVRLSLQYFHQPLSNKGRCQLPMLRAEVM
jgi:hypothetical protein